MNEQELREAIEDWKAGTPAARPELRERVLAAVAEAVERDREVVALSPRRPRLAMPRWGWVAAAASVLIALLLVGRSPLVRGPEVISTSGRLLLDDALAAAEEAERAHARAIARLEELARPMLAAADDPGTPASEARLLIAYRERLASIDAAIAEVGTYLNDNPGLASARTVLLAAYIDKTEILRELIDARNEGANG